MHFVIVGNGVCGITAALQLRERERRANITVISGESDYFFSRTALMYAFMDKLERRQLEPYERNVYKRQRIDLMRGWVDDLDAATHTVRLDDGRTLKYDKLLLATGSVGNLPKLPGLEVVKDGAVRFVTLNDLDACERLAKTASSAVVVGGGLIGVELVECLVHHGIETHFIVRDGTYWPAALFPDEGRMVGAHLDAHGVRLHLHDEIEKVDADETGRVASVTTRAGASIAAGILGLAVGVRPQVDFLRAATTSPRIERGIVVDKSFRTSLPDVFAAGDCAELREGVTSAAPGLVEQIWYAAKRQGALAAQSMLGDAVSYVPPLFFNSSKFFEIEYTTVGQAMNAPAGSLSVYRRHPTKNISLRVLARPGEMSEGYQVGDGPVIGFNMLGSRWNHEMLEAWVNERRPLSEVCARLGEAQFDVELGRVDLRAFDETRSIVAATKEETAR